LLERPKVVGVEPVFPEKDQAIDYAQNRACFRSGEIRVLDSSGKLERTIQFSARRIGSCSFLVSSLSDMRGFTAAHMTL